MKKILYLIVIAISVFGLSVSSALAQNNTTPSSANPKTDYYKAKVTKILNTKADTDPNDPAYDQNIQNVTVTFLDGAEKGNSKDVPYYPKVSGNDQDLKVGETVYVTKVDDGQNVYYTVSERYRFDSMIWLAILFFILVIVIGKYKGFGSLLGLGFSFLVIMKYIVPQILAGKNPLIICLIGAIAIAVVSIYVAHGFNLRTSLAVISTIATIAIALGLDYGVIHWLKLFGSGSEDAVYAQFSSAGVINLRGLLLGGIIIGVLGVLDDITTAQAAVVDELKKANPKSTFKELYSGGISVGKEHIASLINTLVLAYVGASFPLVLLFHDYAQPLTYILNSELVAEEIARALIGGSALVLAVPLTTAFVAYVLTKWNIVSKGSSTHAHHH